MDSSEKSIEDETVVVVERIQEERDRIVKLLETSQLANASSIRQETEDIFLNYIKADAAMLEAIKNPELADSLMKATLPTLMETLQLEVDALTVDLERVVALDRERKLKLEGLKERVAKLEDLTAEASNNQECSLDEIEERIKIKFHEEKNKLKTILATVLPEDTETKNLLALLVEAGLKNHGSYVTMEDKEGVAERIEILMRTQLFEVHPTNRLKMRMLDLK